MERRIELTIPSRYFDYLDLRWSQGIHDYNGLRRLLKKRFDIRREQAQFVVNRWMGERRLFCNRTPVVCNGGGR